MKKQLILLVIALLPCTAFSQVLFDNIWLFGREETGLEPGPRGTEIDFRFSTAYFSQVYLAINFLGSATASICDSTGNLLFYTNGCSIANAAHRGMKDGTGINQPGKAYDLDCLGINSMGLEFGYPTNQGVVILPWPGKKDKYALFHLHKPDPISHQFIQNLKYTVVDMAQDSGLGAVTEKNVQVAHDTFCDMLTAVRHANGRDWWLVLPRLNTGVYYIFLFSPEGVSQPIIQTIGKPNEVQSFGVQATFSPNGKKYANLSWGTGGLQVFDFDRCSGRLSNPVYADFPSSIFWVSGVAFSPGSRFLYCSIGHELHQVDLGGGHSDFDEKIRLVAEYDGYANPLPANFYQLMLAPNGKIYMTTPNGTPYLHVIHHPDSLGLACGFEPRGVTLFADHGF